MLSAALAAFGLVFLAEIGDRTQLIVLTAGTRYRAWSVLLVLTAVIAALQAVGVTMGDAVGDALPERATALLSAALFGGFAIWAWRSADTDDEGAPPPSLWRLAAAFALAEIGDKSMLGGAALAANNDPLGVWLGATLGEAAVTAIGLLAGRALSRRFDPKLLSRAGAVAFALAAAASLVVAIRA